MASPGAAAGPQRPPTSSRAQRLPALTGLRVVAAVSVVFGHFGREAVPHSALPYLSHVIYWVDVFFVLSGFLLGYVCVRPDGLTTNPRSFLISRLARLYPAYLVGLGLAITRLVQVAPHGQGLGPAAKTAAIITSSLVMMQSWVPNGQGWNDPAWSLSAELFFYVVLAVAATWVWPRSSPRMRVVGVLALGAVLSVATAVGLGRGGSVADYVARLPLLRVGPFLVAALVGASYARWKDRLPRGWVMTVLQVAASAAVVGVELAYQHDSAAGHLLSSAASLVLVSLLATGDGLVSFLLDTRPMQILGDASYGIYIYQVGVFTIVADLIGHDADAGPAFWLTFAFLIAISIASSLTFEPTARRWLERAAGVRRSGPVVASPVPQVVGALADP